METAKACVLQSSMVSGLGWATPIWYGANPDVLTESEQETVDAVLRDYGDMPGYELRELTHLEDPWKQARVGVPLMEPCSNEITHTSMRLYYGAL